MRWPWNKSESDGIHTSGLPEPAPQRIEPTYPEDAEGARHDSRDEHVELEQVAYVGSVPEGEMIEGLLRSEGIKCMLQPNGPVVSAGRGVTIGPCGVMVRKADAQKAREVLAARRA